MNDNAPFSLAALYESIEQQRNQRQLSWAALSDQVGVAPSTIKRYRTAQDAEADGVLALVRWLKTEPEQFAATATAAGSLLPAEGYVRVDTAQVAAALDEPSIATRSRMTIQGLTGAAVRSSRPIASLTRSSHA